MIKQVISAQDVISLLNEMLRLDRQATTNLINNRVVCNENMAAHPTIQVQPVVKFDFINHSYFVGMMGVLNGLFGVYDNSGYGCIVSVIGEDGLIERFDYEHQPQVHMQTDEQKKEAI